jgi:spermidine synthase
MNRVGPRLARRAGSNAGSTRAIVEARYGLGDGAMKPWTELDRSKIPGGGELVLCRRGGDFAIRVDGQELMGNRSHASEDKLAALGCDAQRGVPGARVLIGGLGMGFTVRAALRVLHDEARVDVAELVPAVVRWNRGPLAPLAGSPLEDPRVRVLERDVADVLKESTALYDAVLLDVDNGPAALTAPANVRLYDAAGLARTARALRPGGVLAVWSTSDDPKFTARLTRAGFTARTERAFASVGGTKRHVLWIAHL